MPDDYGCNCPLCRGTADDDWDEVPDDNWDNIPADAWDDVPPDDWMGVVEIDYDNYDNDIPF